MHLMLGGCLYAIIGSVLRSFPVDGYSTKFLHTLFISWLCCWMKVMNIGNAIFVSLMAIFQLVITVYVVDLSELIID